MCEHCERNVSDLLDETVSHLDGSWTRAHLMLDAEHGLITGGIVHHAGPDDIGGHGDAFSVGVNNCPMCGRDLRKKASDGPEHLHPAQ